MELEKTISRVLRLGVGLCFILLGFGLVPSILKNSSRLDFYKDFDPLPLADSVQFYLQQKNWTILSCYIALGILILLPFFRLLIMGVGLAKKKELMMSSLSFLVLFLLILSTVLAL